MYRFTLRRSPNDGTGTPPPAAAPVAPVVAPPVAPPPVAPPVGVQAAAPPVAPVQHAPAPAPDLAGQLAQMRAQLDAANMRAALMGNGVRAADLDEAASELLDRWNRSAGADGVKPDLATWIPQVKTKKFAQAYFDSTPAAPGAAVPNIPAPPSNPNAGAAGSTPAAVDPYTPERIAGMTEDERAKNMPAILAAEVRNGRVKLGGDGAPMIARALKRLGHAVPQ